MKQILKDMFDNIPLLFLTLVCIFLFPVITSSTNLGIQDWDHHIAYLESARNSVLTYKQIPLWNPYHCGGLPALGDPQSGIISITFLLVLIFGTVVGVKLSLITHFFIALFSCFKLLEYIKFSKRASIFGSIVFAFSGVASSALSVGMLPFLYFSYLPLAALFIYKGLKEKEILKNSLISGLALALIFYGGYQVTMFTLPVIAIYFIIESLFTKSIKPLKVGLLVFTFFVLFSLPKLILSIQFINQFPRVIDDKSGYSLASFFYFLVSPTQNIHNSLKIPWEYVYFGTDENSMYVGLSAFFFITVGFLKAKIKTKILILLIAILMFGYNLPYSLFGLLRDLPFYDQVRIAQRFRFPFILILSVLASKGIEFIEKRRWGNYISLLLIALVFIDLTIFSNLNFWRHSFILENRWEYIIKPIGVAPEKFRFSEEMTNRVIHSPIYESSEHAYVAWSGEYGSVKENASTIFCHEDLDIPSNILRPARDVIAEYSGRVNIEKWTPNKITFLLDNEEDGILLNQIYTPGWYAKNENGEKRPAVNKGGFTFIDTQASDKKIVVKYKPYRSFLESLIKSILLFYNS